MADKKISELLDTTSLTGEEPIPMVQNNSTVKASVNKIVNGLSEDLTLKTGTVQASADVDALFLKSDPGGASDGAMISLHSNDSNTSNQIYYKGNQHIFNTTSDTRLLTLNQNGASIGDEDPQDPDGNELLTRVEIESLVGSLLKPNIVQAVKTDVYSRNGDTSMAFTDIPDLLVTITPKFSNSKILISSTVNSVGGNTHNGCLFRYTRNDNAIAIGDDSGLRTPCTFGSISTGGYHNISVAGMDYIDSPTITAGESITYRIQVACNFPLKINGSVNNTNANYTPLPISTLTVTEIYQ